jgi:hypothetical protein
MFTALVLVVTSPVAAVPLSVVLSAILTVAELVNAGGGTTAIAQSGVLKFTLGQAYVVLVSSLNILGMKPLLGVPLLLAAAFSGAAFILRTGHQARRVLLAAAAVGSIYPALYVIASLSGWPGTGLFN